jgi:hypothetical protein
LAIAEQGDRRLLVGFHERDRKSLPPRSRRDDPELTPTPTNGGKPPANLRENNVDGTF